MSFLSKFTNPGAKMSAKGIPQQTAQGGIGPSKMKMPSDAGDQMPRADKVGGRFSSKLGNPLSSLPSSPLGPFKGGAPSLFHTSSTRSRSGIGGLGGIKSMPMP